MFTLDQIISIPKLASKENGLPKLFLDPGRTITLRSKGETSVHLRSYADVEFFEHNREIRPGVRAFSRRALITPGPNPHPLEYALWFMDLPRHKEYRDAVKGPFLKSHVSQWEPLVRHSARRRIQEIRERGPSFCVTTDFGQPFALSIISDILGAREEIPDFFRHLARVTEFENMNAYPPEDGLVSILDRIIDVHLDKAQNHGAFGDLIDVYKQGNLSRTEEEGRHILRGYLASLLFAGTDTVAMTLGNVLVGFRRWGLWDRAVKAATADDLATLGAMIHEAFRLDLAFPASAARVVEPVTLPSGTRLPAGMMAVAWLSAANRDQNVFRGPTWFSPKPAEPHLGFGAGYHYCLGAPLASLELLVAVQVLLTELPGLHISGKPKYRLGRVKRLVLPCEYDLAAA